MEGLGGRRLDHRGLQGLEGHLEEVCQQEIIHLRPLLKTNACGLLGLNLALRVQITDG